MAEAIGLIESVAGISQAGVQLSQSLYLIATRLVNAPKQVAEVADELALLSKIFGNLGETLKKARKLCKEEIISNAKSILMKFDALQKDVTELIKKIRGFEGLKYAFGSSCILDLMAKIAALKSSMCLLLSTLKVAIEAEKSKRRSRKMKSTKSTFEHEEAEQYRMLTEAYIESVRHTIMRLRARAREHQETQRKTKDSSNAQDWLTFRHWGESPDETALWLFDMVFTPCQHARDPLDRQKKVHGHAHTVKSAKSDAPASDSEENQIRQAQAAKITGIISYTRRALTEDRTHDLYSMTNTKEIANELLGTWTKLSKEQIEDSESWSALKRNDNWDKTLNKLIRRCIKDDVNQGDESADDPPGFTTRQSRVRRGFKPANTTEKIVRPSAPSPPLEKLDNGSTLAKYDDDSVKFTKEFKTETYIAKQVAVNTNPADWDDDDGRATQAVTQQSVLSGCATEPGENGQGIPKVDLSFDEARNFDRFSSMWSKGESSRIFGSNIASIKIKEGKFEGDSAALEEWEIEEVEDGIQEEKPENTPFGVLGAVTSKNNEKDKKRARVEEKWGKLVSVEEQTKADGDHIWDGFSSISKKSKKSATNVTVKTSRSRHKAEEKMNDVGSFGPAKPLFQAKRNLSPRFLSPPQVERERNTAKNNMSKDEDDSENPAYKYNKVSPMGHT